MKALRIILNIIQVIIIIYVLLVTTLMFCANEYGYTEIGNYVFNSDNNDLLLIKKDNNIKEEDTIYYYSTVNEKYTIVSNKVISINKDDKNSLYTVEEDVISSSKVIGKTTKKIKVLGGILRYLESKPGFLIFVLLPILVIFIYQVYEFVVSIRYREIK